jgi:hypothetical protein
MMKNTKEYGKIIKLEGKNLINWERVKYWTLKIFTISPTESSLNSETSWGEQIK